MTLCNGSNGNGSTCFKDAFIIDGTGREPFTGSLLVREGQIAQVGDIDPEPNGNGTMVIDLAGRTLMPGMILSHVHLSYNHIHDLPDLDLKQPPEVATIAAVCNARLMLECGFTAGLSAGALHMVDIHIRDAINAGKITGPRLLAAGRDICQTGGMLDWNKSWL
jgi:imidazolonepropionase-like amidohydrolase